MQYRSGIRGNLSPWVLHHPLLPKEGFQDASSKGSTDISTQSSSQAFSKDGFSDAGADFSADGTGNGASH